MNLTMTLDISTNLNTPVIIKNNEFSHESTLPDILMDFLQRIYRKVSTIILFVFTYIDSTLTQGLHLHTILNRK